MALLVAPRLQAYLPPVAVPKVSVRFRLLREGEVTTGGKFLRVYRGWDSVTQLALVFWAEGGAGEFTQTCTLDQATLLAQGEWLACGVDDAVPRKTRAVYLTFSTSGTLTFNITSGEGGEGGDAATVEALVKVGGLPASREVVVIERPSSGQWRLAGYGPTPGGNGDVDVKVTDGDCYAIALDDWGIEFGASLSVMVGQTIRPTVYTGWLYRITQAGTLPATEPEWWTSALAGPQPLGTARAEAVRYYQPIGLGPFPVEIS